MNSDHQGPRHRVKTHFRRLGFFLLGVMVVMVLFGGIVFVTGKSHAGRLPYRFAGAGMIAALLP